MAKGSITLTQRLARLGLEDRESDLKNLNVKGGAVVHVTSEDPHFTKRIASIKVKSAAHLKTLLGVPGASIGQDTPAKSQHSKFVPTTHGLPYLAFPAVPLQDKETQAHLTAYLFSTVASDKAPATNQAVIDFLDRTISDAGIAISVVLAADIHVEEGGTLIVGNDVQTLFANAIIVEDGATIRMESPWARIDCARLRFVTS